MNISSISRRARIVLTATIVVAVLSVLVVASVPAFERTSTIKLEFTTPTTLDEAIRLVRDNNLTVEEFTVGDEGMVSGFTVGSRDLASVKDEFLQRHREFLQHFRAASRSVGGSPLPSTTERTAERLQQELDRGTIYLYTITVRASRGSTLPSIPGTIVVEDAQGKESDTRSETDVPGQAGAKSWAPYIGSSDVNQYYTNQYFTFRGTPSSSSVATYEHETNLADRNFANYSGYYSTNMPSSYVDCTWFDSDDKFVIGCSRANQLKGYTTYYTYMSLYPQTSSRSGCTIRGQLGYRYPSWCFIPCTCIWSSDTANLTSFTAPAGISWSY